MSLARILVADDDQTARGTLGEWLTAADYDVVQACDGTDVLNRFAPGTFDCIIADLDMPSLDGRELLKRVRLLDDEVPFLVITGNPDIEPALEAMKAGSFDYITRPFHREDVRLKVDRALRVRKTEASLKKTHGTILTLVILMPVLISLGIIFGIYWKGL